MNCCDYHERILDAIEQKRGAGFSPELEAHVSSCEACGAFAGLQRYLDEALSLAMRAPELPENFAGRVRSRVAPRAGAGVRAVLRPGGMVEAFRAPAVFRALLPDLLNIAGFALMAGVGVGAWSYAGAGGLVGAAALTVMLGVVAASAAMLLGLRTDELEQ